MKFRLSVPGDFVHEPVGRWVHGETWLSFCVSDSLSGFVIWGRPTPDDARALIAVMPVDASPLAIRRHRYVDLRRLEVPHPDSFAIFANYFMVHADRLEQLVRRAAIIYGPMMSGALANGFHAVAPGRYEKQLFTDPRRAMEWLDAPGDLSEDVDALYTAAQSVPRFLRALRDLLPAHLLDAQLAACAVDLGLSPRTLQRRLRAHKTSFQAEVNRARIEAAQRRLLDSVASVTEIAFELGFSSSQSFSTMFHRSTGVTPSQWRAAHAAPKQP